MKQIIFFLSFLLSTFIFSQENEQIEGLEHQKHQLKLKIKIFQDSLEQINIRIAEIESEEFLKKINDSTLTAIAKKGAKLIKSQHPLSEILIVLETDSEVVLLDYDNSYGFFKVCSNTFCGFMNEIWIKSNEKTSYFIKQRMEISRLKSNQKIKSSNFVSSLKKTSTNSESNYNYDSKRSKTYIRGPRGGCYYINSNGNKTYVNRSKCN